MQTVIARYKMQPGKESEALEALKNIVAAVEANEPGALAHVMHRGQVDPSRSTSTRYTPTGRPTTPTARRPT